MLTETRVFAVESVRIAESHVTRQGFGYTSPLSLPDPQPIYYVYRTEVAPDVGNSFQNGRASVFDLAQNLGYNLMRISSDLADHTISFCIRDEDQSAYQSDADYQITLRPLNLQEQIDFFKVLSE